MALLFPFFVGALFLAAASPRLLRTFDAASSEMRLLIAQLRPSYPSVSALAQEHEQLLVALRAGDLHRAQAAWAHHFDESERFFADQIKEHPDAAG